MSELKFWFGLATVVVIGWQVFAFWANKKIKQRQREEREKLRAARPQRPRGRR
jgi:hypothetical protein